MIWGTLMQSDMTELGMHLKNTCRMFTVLFYIVPRWLPIWLRHRHNWGQRKTLLMSSWWMYVYLQILPVVIFFSAALSMLYHLGAMQFIIRRIAWVMQITLTTSPTESLIAAGNIFVGQVGRVYDRKWAIYLLLDIYVNFHGGTANNISVR